MKRYLAVDPGTKRIGIAISDPTCTHARPLVIIPHVSRSSDATRIIELAIQYEVDTIIVGIAIGEDGLPNWMGRQSKRLAAEVTTKTDIPVLLWDESLSSQDAEHIKLRGIPKRRPKHQHLDDHAAAVILQSFLDTQHNRP